MDKRKEIILEKKRTFTKEKKQHTNWSEKEVVKRLDKTNTKI